MTETDREEYRRAALRLIGEFDQQFKGMRSQRDYTEKQMMQMEMELDILRLSPSANAMVGRAEEYAARIIKPREQKLAELRRQLEELKKEIPIFENVIRVAKNLIVIKTEIEE